jgi:GH15 family glucan-1,4-alpha-glucosidase
VSASAQPAIADYALIGDSRSAALVSRDGSIDWLCWPRFDSPSLFARLLDAQRGGHFALRPVGEARAERRYLPGTNVLETTFIAGGGMVRVLDWMPALTEAAKARVLLPFRELSRRVEGVEGAVEMTAEFVPRFDYAAVVPTLRPRGEGCVACSYGPQVLHLRATMPLSVEGPGTARAAFTCRGGERHDLALSYETHTPAVLPRVGGEADWVLAATIDFWRSWSASLCYEGPYREAVLRSALVLKLLAYAPSGGIVAAPTTSLPEQPGGVRNWDYRFCWLRDASFTVAALYDCGFHTEGSAFVDWLLYATRLTHPDLQVLYDVFGESQLPEATLDHLAGYRGARPVRVGNAAHGQLQLDVYGEVLGAIEEYTDRGERLQRDGERLARTLANQVAARWQEPDSGIWEKRSGLHQHVHAKVLAWAALDTALRLVEKGRLRGDRAGREVARWRSARAEIHRTVMERGFAADLGSLVAEYDGRELDASLLAAARVGFLSADDPRLLGTIEAIQRQLAHDDLVLRYRSETTDDGLPPGEGAFLPCSFWLVEALAVAGRVDEAHGIFARLLARANDVGLLAEEALVPSGELTGNFPQALTHIGLLNAALRLERPEARRGDNGGERAASKGLAAAVRPASDR